jgi:hypothetical protein
MSLERLKSIVLPPVTPKWNGCPELWLEVEKQLGTSLPSDYKEFIENYGAGGFYNFLGIKSPFTPKYDLISRNKKSKEYFHSQDIFPVFPDPGGLLYCGGDENGDYLFWLTKGIPDEWPVVYATDDFLEWQIYKLSITDFLCYWLTGKADPNFIRELNVLERNVPIFEPDKDEYYK